LEQAGSTGGTGSVGQPGATGEFLFTQTNNLIHPYPVVDRSLAFGSNVGGGQESTATSSALIFLNGTQNINQHMFFVSGQEKGKALVMLNETGDQNILVASSSGTTQFTLSRTGVVTIGSSGNTFVFDSMSNPGLTAMYNGGTRPAKRITLSPEFNGAVLTASNSSSITGTITSDSSPSAAWRNYYKWVSSNTTLQDYSIAVRVTLPQDFSAWTTSNAIQISYYTNFTSTNENTLDVYIYNDTDTPNNYVYRTVNNVSTSAKTWTTLTIDDTNIDDGTAPDWDAPGETAVFYFTMRSRGNGDVLVGDIILNYLASF